MNDLMNNLQNLSQVMLTKKPEAAIAISMTLFLLTFVFLFSWITGNAA